MDKLKELRKEKGLKQRDVAEYLNMKLSTYSSKECGERKFTVYEGIKLAEFFKCDIKEIFDK